MIIAVAGYLRANSLWRYAGVYFASAGFFSAITLIITWTINNQDSSSKRGTGVVMLNVIGQLGPLLGTRLYPDSDRPYYVKGMSICAGFMFFVFVLSWALRTVLIRENRRIEQAKDYQKVAAEDDSDGSEDEAEGPQKPPPFINIL